MGLYFPSKASEGVPIRLALHCNRELDISDKMTEAVAELPCDLIVSPYDGELVQDLVGDVARELLPTLLFREHFAFGG